MRLSIYGYGRRVGPTEYIAAWCEQRKTRKKWAAIFKAKLAGQHFTNGTGPPTKSNGGIRAYLRQKSPQLI